MHHGCTHTHTHTHTHKEVKITHTLHDIQYIKCILTKGGQKELGRAKMRKRWRTVRKVWQGEGNRLHADLKHTSHTEGETARDEHL